MLASTSESTTPDTPSDERGDAAPICPVCGYQLRGITAARCPECGASAQAARELGWQIPWVHRKSIGTWRAYWRTAALVTFRGRRFFDSLPQRVEYASAQRFRFVTLAMYFASGFAILAAYAAAYLAFTPAGTTTRLDDAWAHVGGLVFAMLAIVAMTGVPSYLFHPRRLSIDAQNRAIALSYYACAPLAWCWVGVLTVVFGIYMGDVRFGRPSTELPWSFFLLTGVAVLVWWWRLAQLAWRVLPTGLLRWRVVLTTPILWLVSVGLAAGLAISLVYIMLMIRVILR